MKLPLLLALERLAAEKVLPSGNQEKRSSLTRSGSLSKVSNFAKKFTPRSRSNSKNASSPSASITQGVKSINKDVEPKKSTDAVATATPSTVTSGTAAAVAFHSAKKSIAPSSPSDSPDTVPAGNNENASSGNVPSSVALNNGGNSSSTENSSNSASGKRLHAPLISSTLDSGDDLDSDLDPVTPGGGDRDVAGRKKNGHAIKPVFTEEVVAPPSNEDASELDDDSEFDEVVSLVTVGSEEYQANRDDPNYMVVDA
ncbi:unnamed protein product [Ambrosiozyma monospora]|uniref:Unnamed protein product n=1 Tax=Ambrosiozyma monospora TaxID=43982 RepID=A0ACB5TRG0_AMBMO|nr:unnamed protein product [Ambrosiozyma monospora]